MRRSGRAVGSISTNRLVRGAVAVLLLVSAIYGVVSLPSVVALWGASAAGLALLAGWLLLAGWTLLVLPRETTPARWVVFAVVAAALRIASAMLADGRVSPGDPHWYLVLAQGLLAGRGLGVDEPFMGVHAVALFPPAYPLLLAAWGWVAGFSTASLTLLSTLIDVATAALIVLLGRALGSHRAGVGAACLYLIWPSQLFDAPLAQKESLATVLALSLAYGWTVAQPRARDMVAIGVAAGLLALTQPGEALLAALFALAQWPRLGLRGLCRIALPAMGVALLVLAPWWWRNWVLLGQFVPLTSAGGYSLWIGNNAGATGNWMPPPAALRGLPELAFSHAAGALATTWIAANPLAFAHLTAAKFVHATGVSAFGIARLAAMRPALEPATAALLLPTSYVANLLLLAGGAAAVRLRFDRRAALLILACLGQLLLVGMWFEFGERHRDFLTPFVLLALALAAQHARLPGIARLRPAPLPG